ncbi:MAG: FUSC family protein, partial [Synergistaceae bacterium]|nr:FUSC family protein [Synergistaceae bacterium]
YKLGNNRIKTAISFQNGILRLEINYLTVIGFIAYIVSFLVFMIILTKYKITYIVPVLSGLMCICVFLGAIFLLHEKTSPGGIAGSVFVLIGIAIINLMK